MTDNIELTMKQMQCHYCCGANGADDIFMNSGYSHVFKIKNSGDVSCTGGLTTGNSNSFLGNLRINGTDYGNTLYQNTVNYDIGISTNESRTSGGNIKFNTRAVTRMDIDGATGAITCNSDILNFPGTLNQYKVQNN